ncbi:hypothetical protein BHM03_00025076 [Ensete ventricosum]|nr:hypothetical protein BHM03_00025076 [Ensete ventricosum]
MLRFEEKLASKMQDSAEESVIDEDKCNMELKSDDDNNKQLLNNDEEDGDNCNDQLLNNYEEDGDNCNDDEGLENESEESNTSVKGWRRVRKIYTRSKQYIFVAATLPSSVDALLDAVNYGYRCEAPDSHVDASRTMVFANTVDAVQSVAKILERVGLECILFHREGSLEERTSNLNHFRKNGGIFVCTDAASRGIDIPNVSHVIQVFK